MKKKSISLIFTTAVSHDGIFSNNKREVYEIFSKYFGSVFTSSPLNSEGNRIEELILIYLLSAKLI